MPAYSVVEHQIPESIFAASEPQECSFGLTRVRPLELAEDLPDNIGCFVVYRDAVSKTPVSVVSL